MQNVVHVDTIIFFSWWLLFLLSFILRCNLYIYICTSCLYVHCLCVCSSHCSLYTCMQLSYLWRKYRRLNLLNCYVLLMVYTFRNLLGSLQSSIMLRTSMRETNVSQSNFSSRAIGIINLEKYFLRKNFSSKNFENILQTPGHYELIAKFNIGLNQNFMVTWFINSRIL